MLKKILQSFPKPLLFIQKKLDIHTEVQILKHHMKPHALKILFMTSILTFPIYSSYIKIPNPEKIPDNYTNMIQKSLLQTLISTLQSKPFEKQSVEFLQKIVQEKQVINALVKLLIESIRDEKFVYNSSIFGKNLALDLVKDDEVKQEVQQLLLRILQDQQFKQEVLQLVLWVFQEQDTRNALGQLLADGVVYPQVKDNFEISIKELLKKLLSDQQMMQKVKSFSYDLIESSDEDGGIKSVIDLVVDKALRRKKQESKQSEFDRLFQKQYAEEFNESLINNQNTDYKKKFGIF